MPPRHAIPRSRKETTAVPEVAVVFGCSRIELKPAKVHRKKRKLGSPQRRRVRA
jgi:hypothetical protein